MLKTPKGMRLHIGIFGRRNVGKSSILNALTRQNASIVSTVAGTTTDPVEKTMEFLPLGPVVFIDTAGIDDTGKLGDLRVQKTIQVLDRTDLAILVTVEEEWNQYEDRLLEEFRQRLIPLIVVFNKSDLSKTLDSLRTRLNDDKISYVATVATLGTGLGELREGILQVAPEEYFNSMTILGDLTPAGELAVFVVPIDKEAPKGRLILPQVQSIRDILDNDAYCLVVKERELRDALDRLKRPPILVVTDSQAFLKVSADTPDHILMTSFSILYARFKGDLSEFVRGALHIDELKNEDKVLIAEACSHHPIADDIGRVKIPRWLTQYSGGKLNFDFSQGHDFPTDLSQYKLVIHCGACMMNRREVLTRIWRCRSAGIPITNYGVAIAYSLGVFERALQPFPETHDMYKNRSSFRTR